MAAHPVNPLLRAAAGVYGLAWELRRRAYARGWLTSRSVSARVVSVGNLTVGGTGKTTLVLHLAERALARGIRCAVVCRRYRPGPAGHGDEELMYREAIGDSGVFAGTRKRDLAARAAGSGAELILVDDGFSHWPLARDLDVVLVDSQDPWGGGALLPEGRLREPLRALQRAGVLVASRLGGDEEAGNALRSLQSHAPGALIAGGRHAVEGFVDLDGNSISAPPRCRVVTATGNPQAVVRTVGESGAEVVSHKAYRDHHWFTDAEARREQADARRADAFLALTAKDAVRWPKGAPRAGVCVLRVRWEWVMEGDRAEQRIFDSVESHATA